MKKQILPLLALRGKMVYPDTSVYFEVSRPKSMAALEQAVNHEQQDVYKRQPYPICSVVAIFKMLVRILNTLRSRIWDMVFFLFSDYSKSTVSENGDSSAGCGFLED